MSAMRSCVAVCATVLLVAGLGVQFAVADSCLAGIKGLFSGDKSYSTLADHLFATTQSTELADNTKAAGSLLSQQLDSKPGLVELVQAFGALKGDSSDPESFCGKENLANLRRVAEGLRDGGNLGPKKITDAILRLNNIVIKVIEDARRVCDSYLAAKWPEPWEPKFSDRDMKERVANLAGVASTYLYEGFHGFREDPKFERSWQVNTIHSAIRKSEMQALNPTNNPKLDPPTSWSEAKIVKQFKEYVHEPCREFVSFSETSEVLAPLNDMLMSWFLVSTGLLKKYYENQGAYKPNVKTRDFDEKVRNLAYMHQACRRFLAEIPSTSKLAHKISKFREADYDDFEQTVRRLVRSGG